MHAIHRSSGRLLVASALAGACAAAMAGTVNVTFVDSPSFADAGVSSWDEKANLDTLATYLVQMGAKYLPADQVLKVEVLDVDLAGTVRPSRRDGSLIRVVRGKADWPKIHVRYSLTGPGIAKSGDEWVSDLNYARGLHTVDMDTPLYYEKRMLQAWFRDRFAPVG